MPDKPIRQFCTECRKETTYRLREEEISRFVKDKEYRYTTIAAYCSECGERISTPGLRDKDIELFDAYYRKIEDLITIPEIRHIMDIYNIGKAPLSLALGFGEITVPRYLEGQMPSKRYSEVMRRALHDPEYMKKLLNANRQRVGETAYKKAAAAVEENIRNRRATPKMQAAISCILKEVVEITPLALQKLLYFAQGLYLASRGTPLFDDDCEAWVHGPVYPDVYSQYKKYGYNPIDDQKQFFDIRHTELSSGEQDVISLVVRSFGLYSGKILECITHRERPWVAARNGLETIDYSRSIITKESIGEYFKDISSRYGMTTTYEIQTYIDDMLKSN